MREMIKAFRELGHEVHPVIMGGTERKEPMNASPTSGGLKAKLKPFIPKYLWETLRDIQLLRFDKRAAIRLEQEIAAFQPDVIYERANYLQLSGIQTAKKRSIPHLLEVNTPYVEERVDLSGKSGLLGKADQHEKAQQLGTNKVLVVSTALQNYFHKKHGIPTSHYLVTPNAIAPEKIQVDASKVEALKTQYDLHGKTVFGFVGSVFPWHGVDIMIEAFAELLPQWPNIRLLIVGGGSYLSQMKQLAKDKGVAQEAIFTNKVPHSEVFAHIDAMDVTVLANSHWYGSPVKIFEYAAMGKAIIAPDNVPVKDVMEDGKDGILVKPNAQDVKRAMLHMLTHESHRHQMAQRFQATVLQHHIWKKVAQNVCALVS